MKKNSTILLVLSFLFFSQIKAQNNFWSDAPESGMKTANQKRLIVPKKFRSVSLDTLQLKQFLNTVPKEFTDAAKKSPAVMAFPMPDGTTSYFSIVESSIMEPALAAKFPNIKTYSGQGIEDRTATIKIDWTDLGFHAQILSAVLDNPVQIDPYALGNKTGYIVYFKSDLTPKKFIETAVEEAVTNQATTALRTQAGLCFGSQLRTYRIAIAATGEYTTYFGGTVALGLSAIVTTLNRVDGIYEKELAVRLVLVANNNLIVFTDPNTDLYTATVVSGSPVVDGALLNQNQFVIDSYIGNANYDIGHLVTTIDGGGLAQRPAVCLTSSKAKGATGLANPSGDSYDVDYVAHEIGHQFGGDHTFNSIIATTSGIGYGCSSSTRAAAYAVEPGSGVTIMAYAGICGPDDIAAHSIPYFHAVSQNEIATYVTGSTGNSCAVTTATGNTPPVVNAGSNYSIPASTPFALTGSATDANGDAITYSWEEIDAGTSGGTWNSGSKPFFRSFSPTLSPTRYFPQLSTVASAASVLGETLPTNAQTLNFRLTARDNRNGGGGVCSADMTLTVVAGTPFKVSSQTTATAWTANGTNTATITWDVAGTTASPFNTANVTILFSADGGLTFPYTLLTSTANDGTENIVIPAVNTTKGRVLVKAIGNVFFSMNTGDISVTSASCAAEGAVISPAVSVSAPAGTSPLNLSLSPQYGSSVAYSGTLVSTDPSANLAVYNTGGSGCAAFLNPFKYNTYTFTAALSGTYTFSRAAGTSNSIMLGLYAGSYVPASSCTNFIASNGTYTGTAINVGGSFTANLTAGATYVLAVGTFNATSPALPANYTINVVSASYTNPGAGFGYNYVIVDNATNLIKAISSTANLSTAATYPNGTSYTVYGVSYNSSHLTTLNSYVGGNFNALASAAIANPGTFCVNLSKNTVTVNVQSVVPVTFLGLKARKQDKNVVLEWATASEVNSDYFAIQRSTDGINFTIELGKLSAAGNSSSIKNYSTKDVQPISGWNYYRIKQVDKDGHTTYSNVAAINFEKAGAIVIVYPNPAKDKLNIEYTSTKSGNIQMQVMDSKGSLILSNNATVIVGRNTNTLNIASLSKGVYVLRCMDAENNISFVKFIKE